MKVSFRNAKRNSGGVDLSPMLDVIFQLILFFLVSTSFSVLPAINVKLPVSTTASGQKTGSITITVLENGGLWFNDEKVTMEELDKCLLNFDVEGVKKEEFPVLIAADSNVTNGKIVSIFDVLRKNGFSSVSLRTMGIK